ncbi:MAG: hypothetical protein ACRCYY_17065 [Trueperaceae bacterium]
MKLSLRQRVFAVLGFLLLGFNLAFAADIGLSPARLDLTVEPGETITETITLLTDAVSEQQIQVEVSDFTLDPVGELNTLPAGSLEYSSANWLQPELTDFVLAGSEGRDFRISVTVPEDASLAGSYHAMVFFTVVPPPTETQGIGVITTTRIGLTIYVTVSNSEDNSAELVDFFQNDEKTVTFAVANTGNTVMRLGGQVELRDEAGETKYALDIPDLPVLCESEREVTLELPTNIESGFYTALALVEDSRRGLLVGELPIKIE